jgi:hypothetical protein
MPKIQHAATGQTRRVIHTQCTSKGRFGFGR